MTNLDRRTAALADRYRIERELRVMTSPWSAWPGSFDSPPPPVPRRARTSVRRWYTFRP